MEGNTALPNLDKEECHSVSLEGPTQLNVSVLGIDFSHTIQLAMLLQSAGRIELVHNYE